MPERKDGPVPAKKGGGEERERKSKHREGRSRVFAVFGVGGTLGGCGSAGNGPGQSLGV